MALQLTVFSSPWMLERKVKIVRRLLPDSSATWFPPLSMVLCTGQYVISLHSSLFLFIYSRWWATHFHTYGMCTWPTWQANKKSLWRDSVASTYDVFSANNSYILLANNLVGDTTLESFSLRCHVSVVEQNLNRSTEATECVIYESLGPSCVLFVYPSSSYRNRILHYQFSEKSNIPIELAQF